MAKTISGEFALSSVSVESTQTGIEQLFVSYMDVDVVECRQHEERQFP